MSAQEKELFQFDTFVDESKQEKIVETGISKADIERAEEVAFEKGKQAALESLEANKMDAIKRISEAIETAKTEFHKAIKNQRSTDLLAVRSFLQTYIERDKARSNIDEISNGIQAFMESSVTLPKLEVKLNPISMTREGADLERALQDRFPAETILIRGCETIKKGDFEIRWHDGSLSSKSEHLTQAVDDLINRLEDLSPNGEAE